MSRFFLIMSFLFSNAVAIAVPVQPTDNAHPGSASYKYTVKTETIKDGKRDIVFFAPQELMSEQKELTLIAFGHGQAISLAGYEMSFEHMARKGYAVVFPQYDTGFFDQNWERMAADFNAQVSLLINKYPKILSSDRVVYSGHSKGAYVALTAAGLKSSIAKSMILFAPAGFIENRVKDINPQIPVTLVWGSSDKIIKESLIESIYDLLPSVKKQFIKVTDYSDLEADHFFPLSKKFVFGGKDGVGPYHYFGTWPWMIGALEDLQSVQNQTNVFLYSDTALETGIENLKHEIKRSW